jgi:sugar porter (SP) family MFS transporter
MIIASSVFLLGGTLMTASRGSLDMIYGGRAIAGLGIGASSMVVPVYISETAPPSIRGRLVGIFEIASQGGGMLGFWINYICDRAVNVESQTQWVVPLAIQLIPGVLLLLGVAWCPESHRYLAKNDNFEGAERILCKIRGLDDSHAYIQHEMSEIRAQVEQRSANRQSKKAQFMKLFQKGVRNRMAIGLALMFLQSFTGVSISNLHPTVSLICQVNIITYYAPRIFETLGISGTSLKHIPQAHPSSTSLKLFSTGFYGIAKTLGMFTFTFIVVEKVGRRKGLIWGAALGCIPMWYIGGYVMKADPAAAALGGDITRTGWGYLAMVCVYVNAFIICATWQGITWTYASEIFPLDIRMLCVSLTTADTWLGSFIIARSTPYMISDLGYGAYFSFASILVAMGIWSFFFVPETKGISLEEMDTLFLRPMHKAVWAQLRRKPILTEEEVIALRNKGLDSALEEDVDLGRIETDKK